VSAALGGDPEQFDRMTIELAGLDRMRVELVLGTVLRSALEQLHPDGIDGDDVNVVLRRCLTRAATWFPGADVSVLILVLTGALGMQDPDESQPPVSGLAFGQHAVLLVADLVTALGVAVETYIDVAVGEIARVETMEMP
jgi:hypothetical protein